MNQLRTTAIILGRTDFGEADRILTMLTPDHGKLRLIAKGVRRVKSKLAGGIELFSVSDISYIKGRGEISTLVSTQLIKHYAGVVGDISRTMLGYDLIKLLDKVTEDQPEAAYFELLQVAFAALDSPPTSIDLIRLWFMAQLLKLGGHTPNLQAEAGGHQLVEGRNYEFSFDDMAFFQRPDGHFTSDHIKFLRVLFSETEPQVIQKIAGSERFVADTQPLVQTMGQTYLRTGLPT